MTTGLAVGATGMVTPLGFNAPATLAALRAGVGAVRSTPWIDFESGEPLRGARVSLPHWWFGVGMQADLAAAAIHECLTAAGALDDRQVTILVGVAAAGRPGRPAGLDEELLDEIHARLRTPRHPASRLLPFDQFGCAHGLVLAGELLARGHAARVVLAGVDSFLHVDTLRALMQRRRLMTAGNSNGFFPSEAAAAVMVEPAASASLPDPLEILGIGCAREPATIDGTLPLRASGLTSACQQALAQAGLAMRDVAYRLTDLSGEHYKFKEAAFVAGRLNTADRVVPLDLWHPIEYLGDIGAAILPCLLAQAGHAAREGYAPGDVALCHVGSDAGERAAIVVRRRGTAQGASS